MSHPQSRAEQSLADPGAAVSLELMAQSAARPSGDVIRPPRIVTAADLQAVQKNVDIARSGTFSPATVHRVTGFG